MPWPTLRRLALEAGFFAPSTQPVTDGELARLLARVRMRSVDLASEREVGRLGWLLQRYDPEFGPLSWHGCECKEYPLHLRISGRMLAGDQGMGNPVPGEPALPWGPGSNVSIEPSIEAAVGSFWAAFTPRLWGKVSTSGEDFGDPGQAWSPLTWPYWDIATSRSQVRTARLQGSGWSRDITRAVLGAELGRWSLTAGWDGRRTGPGITGAIVLDREGNALPALTARRTEPFVWSGIMKHLAFDDFLLRVGRMSDREVDFNDETGNHIKEASPWFFQWLIGWEVTSWFRLDFTHAVMATARSGTLWPDLLQINFPVIGTTIREGESGPITDRVFAAQFEFRWRRSPVPLLPSAAGRLFWDYAGTDFLPSGPGGVVPEISIPGSVLGIELYDADWDLAYEYSELLHDKVVWYSNGGYTEGYSERKWLIGHPLGGTGESHFGRVRLRIPGTELESEAWARRATWGIENLTRGGGTQSSVGVVLRRIPMMTPFNKTDVDDRPRAPLVWEVGLAWYDEEADPQAFPSEPASPAAERRTWWSLQAKLGF